MQKIKPGQQVIVDHNLGKTAGQQWMQLTLKGCVVKLEIVAPMDTYDTFVINRAQVVQQGGKRVPKRNRKNVEIRYGNERIVALATFVRRTVVLLTEGGEYRPLPLAKIGAITKLASKPKFVPKFVRQYRYFIKNSANLCVTEITS
jgi:hypothetical protein